MWNYDKDFRFQTNCKEIYQRLKRRDRFWLVGWAINADLWIFQAMFPTTQKALYVLNNLTDETAWTSLTLQDSERSHKLTLQRRIYDTEETQIPERV